MPAPGKRPFKTAQEHKAEARKRAGDNDEQPKPYEPKGGSPVDFQKKGICQEDILLGDGFLERGSALLVGRSKRNRQKFYRDANGLPVGMRERGLRYSGSPSPAHCHGSERGQSQRSGQTKRGLKIPQSIAARSRKGPR
jgi:hypothetical protein